MSDDQELQNPLGYFIFECGDKHVVIPDNEEEPEGCELAVPVSIATREEAGSLLIII